MKNLIEKIEKALQDTERLYRHTSEIYNGYLKSHYRGKMEAYMNILDSLKGYNIINAPKEIKLSEILDRLTNELKDYVVRYVNNSGITICQNGWFYATVYIDRITHNIEFDQDGFNFPKWLYTLWIANTIIEDDLE